MSEGFLYLGKGVKSQLAGKIFNIVVLLHVSYIFLFSPFRELLMQLMQSCLIFSLYGVYNLLYLLLNRQYKYYNPLSHPLMNVINVVGYSASIITPKAIRLSTCSVIVGVGDVQPHTERECNHIKALNPNCPRDAS